MNFDVSDYGPAAMAPSREAEAVRDQMSTEEKSAFDDLLFRLERSQEQVYGASGIAFHPEARACMWGLSLSKIADAYSESGQTGRALFYMNAAWEVSHYPLFANNAALLSIATGETARAKNLFEYFLNEYKSVLKNEIFVDIMGRTVTFAALDNLAMSARKRLFAIETGKNPMSI